MIDVFKRPVLIALVLGIVLGATGAVLAPPLVSPHLPRSVASGDGGVAGEVVAKSREADRLLMTVAGEQGAVLVTVTKRIKEIDLLVEVGDSVTLLVSAYEPFAKDPKIGSVRKGSMRSPQGERSAEPTQQGAVMPPHQDSTRAPGPAEFEHSVDTLGGREG